MVFQLKQQPSDFLVEEHLEISGEGEYFAVFFEKENRNTMDIVHALCKEFQRSRKDIGLSGLKDKKAITKQRFSFHKDLIHKVGKEQFLTYLGSLGIVLSVTEHKEQIRVGSHTQNSFKIVLRPRKKVTDDIKERIINKAEIIKNKGFPNTYGKQRFGKGSRNYKRAIEILEQYNETNTDSYQQTFALQAYPSYWFNKYCETLGESLFESLEGTLEENGIPTGPLLGKELSLPKKETQARYNEQKIIEESLYEKYLPGLSNFGIWGRRRALYCKPQDFSYTREGTRLHVQFILPVGSYATSLIEYLLSNCEGKQH